MNEPFSAAAPFAFEFPETVRAFAETEVAEARERYAKLKSAAESGNEAIGQVFESATRGVGVYTAKVMELSKTNTEAAFAFSLSLMAVTSLPQALELWGTRTRSQIETFVEQSRQLAELGQSVVAETVAPIKETASKTLSTVT